MFNCVFCFTEMKNCCGSAREMKDQIICLLCKREWERFYCKGNDFFYFVPITLCSFLFKVLRFFSYCFSIHLFLFTLIILTSLYLLFFFMFASEHYITFLDIFICCWLISSSYFCCYLLCDVAKKTREMCVFNVVFLFCFFFLNFNIHFVFPSDQKKSHVEHSCDETKVPKNTHYEKNQGNKKKNHHKLHEKRERSY